MNQNNNCIENSNNVSRFLVPFYVELKNKREKEIYFSKSEWEPVCLETRYLTKYIQEIYSGKQNSICNIYRLKEDKRHSIGLPLSKEISYVTSKIIQNLEEQEYTFHLKDIMVYYYATGIGFLVFTVLHKAEEPFQKIVDKCFALSNIFMNEHDSGEKESKVRFYYQADENKIPFSLKNSIFKLLKTDKFGEKVELFPTNARRKMNGYHRVFRKEVCDCDKKYMTSLSKGLYSGSIEKKTADSRDEGRFFYATTDHTSWDVCSNGVTFLIYDQEENHVFLSKHFTRNVDVDYFLVYLFALHERENLLRYNYQVVKNWENQKKLTKMKTELMRFNVWSGYNTVSAEMAYQDFYTYLYQALEIEKLEKDVQEIIVKVNEYVTGEKDRKLNAILAVVGFLAVFSVFNDGLGLIDRIYGNAPFLLGHGIVVGVICFVLGISILFFLYKRK